MVGSTGSGKSTLISLICRLFDVTDGAVRIDGVDVRDYDIEQLWATIGLVPQRGYLFSGTVAENLRIGKADATADEMWEALRVAAADGFVSAHPDGLDMPVAQGGINFSGGQRQRLAIARAVIRRPAIYLFDDAFSALDVHTDARVRAALREVSATATVLIVSQRISTVAEADQVVVIDDGVVVGVGTHESLLHRLSHLCRVRGLSVRWRGGDRDERPDDPPDRWGRTTGGAVQGLQGLGRAVGETAYPATDSDRHRAVARHRRHRDRSHRTARPRPCHRPAVQRRDRARTACGHHQASRPSTPRGPGATTASPTCCPA